ncbi:DUF6992 family protein [Tengunoibacter tsumagoiensis]|uniref:Uncharacterized protein n=1 Tax=Tengunoibacter tsumagoiensis TaxID=2014871 RepID=A0A402A0E8_9CHLR|nr:hypothetical protein [Tengunoibacter tsumagoiensis]GCE12628.1 hypothetical protein KTT_24870 [Tengunoibacter tsumagoiensis]
MKTTFYHYQHRRMTVLAAWGIGSILSGGLLLSTKKNVFWKQFGLQFLLWGAIDAAIALFGSRSAQQNAQKVQTGEISALQQQRSSQSFLRIVFLNAILDLLYMGSGLWLVRRYQERKDRQGMGLGILLQGTWLFLFDSFLTIESRQFRQVAESDQSVISSLNEGRS